MNNLVINLSPRPRWWQQRRMAWLGVGLILTICLWLIFYHQQSRSSIQRVPMRPKNAKLQAFPLQALQLVGILQQGNHAIAAIHAPNNRITLVHIGDRISLNLAKVKIIHQNSIALEWDIMRNGQRLQQVLTLSLQR